MSPTLNSYFVTFRCVSNVITFFLVCLSNSWGKNPGELDDDTMAPPGEDLPGTDY